MGHRGSGDILEPTPKMERVVTTDGNESRGAGYGGLVGKRVIGVAGFREGFEV